MSTKTLGTNATTSLTAVAWSPIATLAADIATVGAAIKSDGNTGTWSNSPFAQGVVWPGALEMLGSEGQLIIPNRGILKVMPGDYIGIDSQGWPILVSAYSIANAAWTHS